MHPLYLGDEAIVHRDRFTLEGADMKACADRGQARRAGPRLRADRRDRGAARSCSTSWNEISAEWRDGSPERGFTMELGEEVEGDQPRLRARDRQRHDGGRVAGFLRFVPSTATNRATRST